MRADQQLVGRRNFIKKLSFATAGASASALLVSSTTQIKQGGEIAKDELDRLSDAYADLDKRTKMIVRGMCVLLGIDVLLII
jgi:inactivated superfamily I helicase